MRHTRGRTAAAMLGALALAGCGGERQDADAPSGRFDIDVTHASFPARQRIAEPAELELRVANTGDRAVPDLAVVVETATAEPGQAPAAFGQSTGDPTLAAATRPVWILDEGPAGGDSAYANTWTVGPLDPGRSRTVAWKLTAARAGRYTVRWRVAAALEGDVELGGGRTRGSFDVTIADDPVPARVGDEGEVVREEAGR